MDKELPPPKSRVLAELEQNRGQLDSWLDRLARGGSFRSLRLGPDEWPIGRLVSALRERATEEQRRVAAAAACRLLDDWIRANPAITGVPPTESERLRGILAVLEVSPGNEDGAARLIGLVGRAESADIDGLSEGVRRRLIHALAIADRPVGYSTEYLIDLWSRYLTDPRFAVAAFAALRRVRLDAAIGQLGTLVETCTQHEVGIIDALFALFKAVEQAEDAGLAAMLVGEIEGMPSELRNTVERLIRDRFALEDRFPAIAYYHGGGRHLVKDSRTAAQDLSDRRLLV